MRYLSLFLIGFLLTISSLFAQKNTYSVRNKRAIQAYEASENFLIRRQYGQAVQLLQQALDKAPEFTEARLRLAGIYRAVGRTEQAWEQLQLITQEKAEIPAEGYFAIGELAWQLGKYREAEENLQQFLDSKPRSRPVAEEAERLLSNARFAQEQLKEPVDFSPEPLPAPVNEFAQQYFPVLTVDQQSMFYTVLLRKGPVEDEDLFVARRKADGSWEKPKPLASVINSTANEGTCTISADGRMLIFTSCRGRQGLGSCDLYVSYKEGEEWSEPKNLGTPINSRAWESQPALSADGQTLYFVSDRAGGLGKRDIYRSRRDSEGKWQKPENLGAAINTKYDEVSPYLHVNGQTLYFASDGHPGMGGFDLYVSEQEDSAGWQQVRNIGYPVNDQLDQVSLFVTADGSRAYYARELRRGTPQAESKLYTFSLPENVRVRNRSNFVRGTIRDAETKKPLAASVSLYELKGGKVLQQVTSDSVTGAYVMVLTEGAQYAVYADRAGYLFNSLSFDARQAQAGQLIELDVLLNPIRSGAATVLNNIFFDTDSDALREESRVELDKVSRFLQQNPDVKIRVAGHTDDVGSAIYNQQLSERRAQAVKNYLLSKKIAPARIQVIGYGASRPRVPNTSEDNRALNRRIVFEIQ